MYLEKKDNAVEAVKWTQRAIPVHLIPAVKEKIAHLKRIRGIT